MYRRFIGRRFMDRLSPRSQGFTLLELVLAIAISGLVITAVSSLLLAQIMHWQRLAAEMEARAALERSLAMIIRDIRDGASLIQPAGADSVTSWLELRLPVSSLSSTAVVRYAYDATDQEIQRNGQPLAGAISSLAFDYTNYPPLVHVTISGYGFGEVVHVVQGTAALRSQIR